MFAFCEKNVIDRCQVLVNILVDIESEGIRNRQKNGGGLILRALEKSLTV